MNKPECKTYPNGTKWWYLNGDLHREDGPACEWANGDKWWYLNGKYHREDGPAIELANGDKEWYLNGEPRREDGPACELTNGGKEWYLNGEEVNPETIADLWLAKNIYCIYNPETDCLEFE
jgi:hypothetical protein